MASPLPSSDGSRNSAHLKLSPPNGGSSLNGVKKASSVSGSYRPSSTAFDPRALLDPKRFSQRPASEDRTLQSDQPGARTLLSSQMGVRTLPWTAQPTSRAEATQPDDVNLSGMGSLIERIHGVSHREGPPLKRQKLVMDEQENSDHEGTDSNFSGGGKGGVIGDYIRQKRAEGKQEAALMSTVVDLTGADDDDIVVVSDSSEKEVCYGSVEGALVQAHAVPSPSSTAQELDPAFWPLIKVELRRKSRNTNIISVFDPLGNDFGTVASSTAIGLAPLMDAPGASVRVQARILSRRKKYDERVGDPVSAYHDLSVNLYGPRKLGKSIGKFLSQKQIWLRTPLGVDAGIETENPHSRALALRKPGWADSPGSGPGPGYVARTIEEVRQEVIGVFDSLQKSENVPQMEADPRIKTPLLSHQKQALYFMTNKENERALAGGEENENPLWRTRVRKNGEKTYYNVITGKEERTRPAGIHGGILADMMGLGKTLSILSLVVSSLVDSRTWGLKKPPPATSPDQLPLLRNAKTTLLVSPLSTIANWEEQINTHIEAETLSYYIYHGGNRCDDPDELAECDLVITTYHVVASEFDKRSKKMRNGGVSPLQQINWFRIVLDEAHMIREQSTRQSKAICALSAQRRWAVTGTPVQNRLDDLGALIKFLRISPFDEKNGFTQFILGPFKNADPDILPKLRLLVDSITLRRLKDRIDLPARHDRIVRLEFGKEERALYDLFAKDSANKMKIVASEKQGGLGGRAYVYVLRAILRLRLICAHGKELLSDEDLKLAKGANINNAIDLEGDDDGKSALHPRQAYDMFHLMKETNADTCSQCSRQICPIETMSEEPQGAKDDVIGYLTPCFQLLCRDCITNYQTSLRQTSTDSTHATCPLCNAYIKISLFKLLQSKVEEDEERRALYREKTKPGKKIGRYGGPHAKTRALLEFLGESRLESEAHPDERPIKSVVFSGWTTHLDLIQMALDDNNIACVRLDGKMTRVQRAASMEKFREDPSITVMLVSISAGGLGLNLTAASKVYVMEPQFNPAAEAQAIDRVHRLGQSREVTTTRFIMADSFEEKMLELQRKKQNLADLSMNRSKLDKEEATKRRLEELRSLFK